MCISIFMYSYIMFSYYISIYISSYTSIYISYYIYFNKI